MTEREALKLALEALELHGQQYPHMVKGYCLDAITALREALAEQLAQQQEQLTSQKRDAQRWRFLMENSYDSGSATQFHVWEHSWEPRPKTGEPTGWKQRVRGIALIDFIDRAIEAKLKEKNT